MNLTLANPKGLSAASCVGRFGAVRRAPSVYHLLALAPAFTSSALPPEASQSTPPPPPPENTAFSVS